MIFNINEIKKGKKSLTILNSIYVYASYQYVYYIYIIENYSQWSLIAINNSIYLISLKYKKGARWKKSGILNSSVEEGA